MKSNSYILILIILTSLFISCKEEDTLSEDPTKGLVKVLEVELENLGLDATLWAHEALFVGYNPLFIQLTNSGTGQPVTDAVVQLDAMMYMSGGMSHSCPLENPVAGDNGLYQGAAVFVMPTSEMGNWELILAVTKGTETANRELDIEVVQPDLERMTSFVAESGERYFVSYFFPNGAKMGVNDVEVVVHRRLSGMEWPAATDLTLKVTPEMPSMGHGSPNNVDPVHQASGHYAGKVNFTMTGDWRLNLELWKGDGLVKSTYFDLTVQ